LLIASPALLSAADPLAAARAEAAAAEREQRRLEGLVASAGSTQARLRAEQAAATQGILAAEARLAAVRLQALAAERQLAAVRERLTAEQRPAALLLAGVAQYGRRPPLLALAAGGSVADIVHLRALVSSTLPVVQARTAGLRDQLAKRERLAARAADASARAAAQQRELRARQQRFAALEVQLNRRLADLGDATLGAGDLALSQVAEANTAAGQALLRQRSRRAVAELQAFGASPARPFPPADRATGADFDWQLPLAGPVLNGLGEISASGVRSRGLVIGSRAGAAVLMPATGTIVFAGPFRRHLSVLVLDHGGGWMTLMTEVRTTLPRGTRLSAGEPLGRTLGNVTVELSRSGRPQPAALIAGSSPLLSKGGQPS
jgi:septal ring factor EnvC (AmiA/AmiB activator)